MRHENGQWVPYAFKGTKWQNIGAEKRRIYQLNAYRVLLTRARQGMVIFIPEGDPNDPTRPPIFYYSHSLRDRLREAGVDREIIDQLGGWSVSNVGESYGAGHSLGKKYEAMERIVYST